MAYRIIDNVADLAEYCKAALAQEIVAVDTEFVWRNTYYPKFALLQIAWNEENCVLIDPLAIEDKAPLVELMEAPGVKKVFHAAFNDIPIIERWANCHICNIGDTIVAAGFANLTARLSLAKLFATQMGLVLTKTETRSDWLQRPLSEAQLEYAGDDVAKLVALYQILMEKVEALGNLAFYNDEMEQRSQPGAYDEMPLDECWLRVSRSPFIHFTKQDYAVLSRLAAWREGTARAEDVPRNAVFRDEWLVQAAIKHPYTQKEVAALPGMWFKVAKVRGDAVAKVVSAAMKLQPQDWPDMSQMLFDRRIVKQRSERVVALMNKRAEARGIDPMLLGSHRAAQDFVLAANSQEKLAKTRLMNGWCHELLSPAIDDIADEYYKKRMMPR